MRAFLALLASLVVTITFVEAGKGLLGAQKCTWGPSYWCQGLKESSECSATKHCIRKYWNSNPQKYQGDDDDVCQICKNMVKEARDQLLSNETQEELQEVFEGSCALIPIKIISSECKKLVDEFVPELVETLASEMNPDTVCSVAGLCNSKKIDKLLLEYGNSLNLHKSDCEVCKEQSQKLSMQIRNADKDLVLDKILEMCGHAGSYSDACRVMVLDDFEDIYQILTNLDAGLCDLAGICPSSSSEKTSLSTISNGADIQCEFCEKVIQHWINTWTSNTTEEEFKTILEALCHKMKPERVQHCLTLVDDYYLPWFNYILHELNPKTACSLMGLCNGQFLELNPKASISLLLTDNDEVSVAPKTLAVNDKPTCVMCEYVIHKIQHFLSDNKTEEEIEAALEKVCGFMPKSVRNKCDDIVETYGPAIIQMISEGIDPKEVCTEMHLCDENRIVTNVQDDLVTLEMEKADDYCPICQYAMETVFQMLENKDNEDEVRNTLETLCQYMPSSIEDKCEEYIDAYIEDLIQFILKSLTPNEICAELGLCKPVPKEIVLTPQDTKCVVCEYVMTTLDQILANKTTEAEIRDALEQVCDYMPSSVHDQCTKFVDLYAETIIDFLTHQLSPGEICQQLGLCPGKESNAEQFQMLAHVDEIIEEDVYETENDRPYCTLCEYAIGEVDKLITDKKNEEQIKSVLDRICYELSAPIKKECLQMVNTYTDEIIEMFVNEYTPQEVCSELGLCDEPTINMLEIQTNDIPQETAGPLCVLCEYAMMIVEKEILNNRTLDMVEHAVLMICSYMPNTVTDKCVDFVQEYGDEIIDLIVKAEMNPEMVCSALTLCTGSEQRSTWDASPVGGNQCAWGPAFWCQSKIHARACGTTQHCEQHVWNNENNIIN